MSHKGKAPSKKRGFFAEEKATKYEQIIAK